ncbi:MAG: metallophosphoesterase family protein [Lachnospiraceae bacterium]|nr:metallophosphoesterase family protein [Lachnospiraceae bacterium]
MKLAVFSDIHANYTAFETCLTHALSKGITTFIFLGDYSGEFPYPEKTMEMLYHLREKYTCFFIRGNKEDYWLNRKYDNNCEWKDGNLTVGALLYSYAHQTEEDLNFFQTLPICREVCFEGTAPLLICHGSPDRNTEKMLPGKENTLHILEECPQKYILCGHTHMQYEVAHEGRILLNPGAVGVPLCSGGKTQFMILQWEGTKWHHEFISLEYDKEKVLKELQESGLNDTAPYWSRVTAHLILTGEISHGTVLTRAMDLCKKDGIACKWYNVPEKYWEQAIAELISL